MLTSNVGTRLGPKMVKAAGADPKIWKGGGMFKDRRAERCEQNLGPFLG